MFKLVFLLFGIFSMAHAHADAVKAFESGLTRCKALYPFAAAEQRNGVHRTDTLTISAADYDVKKSDSLVTPVVAELKTRWTSQLMFADPTRAPRSSDYLVNAKFAYAGDAWKLRSAQIALVEPKTRPQFVDLPVEKLLTQIDGFSPCLRSFSEVFTRP